MKAIVKSKVILFVLLISATIGLSLLSTKPAYAAEARCYIYSEPCQVGSGLYIICTTDEEIGGPLHCTSTQPCPGTVQECQ